MDQLPVEPNPWKVLSEQEVYDNPWIRITQYAVLNPSGAEGIYGKVHFKNRAIGIVALDQDNQIYLVGQFRFVLDRYSWELPEGGGPLNETPLEAAKRELLEETGLVAANWELLLQMDLSNSVTDEVATVYLATSLVQKQPSPEPTEQLQTMCQPLTQVFNWVMQGKITDSITVASILKLKVLGYC